MYKLLILLYFLSIYLVPSTYIFRPEYFLSFAIAFYALFTAYRHCVAIYAKEILLLLLLSVGAVLSVLFQNLIGAEMIYRDLMILVRYVYYILAIISGGFLAYKLKDYHQFNYLIFALILVTTLISIFQYHNIFSINNYMSVYIGEKNEALAVGYHWRRVIGTFGNPNYWGLFLNFCMIICLYQAIFKRRYIWLTLTPLIFVSVLYTGSRTTLVSLVISTFIIIYLVRKHKVEKVSKNIIIAMLLISILAVGAKLLLSGNHTEIYSGKDRFSADNITTLEMRINHWHKMITHTFNHPIRVIIGGGESKGKISVYGDNMYIKYFRDYGFIGFMVYVVLIIYIYRRIMEIIINNTEIRHLSIPFLWMYVCLLVFDLAADSWFVVRIAGLILFFYGFIKVASKNNLSTEVEIDDAKSLDSSTKLERWGTRLR